MDDNIFNLYPLEGMLEALYDFKCTVCITGEEAVRLFTRRLNLNCCSRSYDLVLTDIQMPKLDGFMVAKLITAAQNNWPSDKRHLSLE